MFSTLTQLFNALRPAPSRRTIDRLVQADLSSAPMSGDGLSGQRILAAQLAARRWSTTSFDTELALALTLALVLATIATLLWLTVPSGDLARIVVGGLGIAAAYMAYIAVLAAQRQSHVGVQCVILAHERPRLAGDLATPPLSAMGVSILMVIISVDAFFAGMSVATWALGAILSPSGVLMVAAAWSAALAALLWHLSQAAASEIAIVRRRAAIRAQLKSGIDSERWRGQKMFEEVADALGHDLDTRQDRTRARWTLAVVIASLSIGTFVLRIATEG